MVYLPALTPKQDISPSVSVTNPGLRDFSYASRKYPVISTAAIVVTGSLYPNNATSSSYANPVGCIQLICQLAPSSWL